MSGSRSGTIKLVSIADLDTLLNPESLVVIGASAREGSPGLTLASNLNREDFSGQVHLVNPRYDKVLGRTCLKSVKDLPGPVDLALILVPRKLLRRTLVDCARKGIRLAVIYSGADDPADLHRYARRLGMRLLGPWCAGLIRPHIGLNASLAPNRIQAGSLALVSQSATLAAALVDWAESSKVGFSALLSTGADTDVRLHDLLDLLADDYRTRAIIVYLDRVNGTRAFLSALSAVARRKPVVLMKSTHDSAAYCDALTRNGREFTSDDTFQAALSRAGVVRIRTFSNLFSAAKILASRVRTQGTRLAVISNGAAPAMLACERLEQRGFSTPVFDDDLLSALDKALAHTGDERSMQRLLSRGSNRWSGTNPVVLRDAEHGPEQFKASLNVLGHTRGFDAVLVIFTPDARSNTADVARAVIAAKPPKIPMIACWMGESQVHEARELFAEAGIPCFRTPEAAADAFDFLNRYHRSQQQLLQLPAPTARDTRIDIDRARSLVQIALESGERVLGPQRTRLLLTNLDIDVMPAIRATTSIEAISAASRIGYPVVVKLVSPNIAWKAPIIHTALNVEDDTDVQEAFSAARNALHTKRPDAEFRGVLIERQHTAQGKREIAISLQRDPVFGPVISVGIGGDLSSLVQRRVVQLPPLNPYLIEEMLNESPLADYLGSFRHHDALDTAPLVAVLRRVSEIACELPDVFSLDINPLIVSDEGAVAIDVHVVLERARQLPGEHKRYGHLSIHPWPRQWTRVIQVKDERELTLRAIRPGDSEGLQSMVKAMSDEARYFRFMHAINALSPAMLAQFTKLDYDRQIAFVAVTEDDAIAGVSRYTIDRTRQSGEFAVTVAQDWQGQGLATFLMNLLAEHARSRDLSELHGDVLTSNGGMRHLMDKLGYLPSPSPIDHDVLTYTLTLDATADATSDTTSHT